MLVAVASRVRKGDLGSYKKGFSSSSCFDQQHHGCCTCPAARVPAACGEAETPFEGNRRGATAQGTCTPMWLPVHRTPLEERGPGAETHPEKPVLASAEPAAAPRQRPPREPGTGRTRSLASPRLGRPGD